MLHLVLVDKSILKAKRERVPFLIALDGDLIDPSVPEKDPVLKTIAEFGRL